VRLSARLFRSLAGQHGLHSACGIFLAGWRHKALLGKSGGNLAKAAAIIKSDRLRRRLQARGLLLL
jgi:hypothetical protein